MQIGRQVPKYNCFTLDHQPPRSLSLYLDIQLTLLPTRWEALGFSGTYLSNYVASETEYHILYISHHENVKSRTVSLSLTRSDSKLPVVQYPSIRTFLPTNIFHRRFTSFIKLFKTKFAMCICSPVTQQFSPTSISNVTHCCPSCRCHYCRRQFNLQSCYSICIQNL